MSEKKKTTRHKYQETRIDDYKVKIYKIVDENGRCLRVRVVLRTKTTKRVINFLPSEIDILWKLEPILSKVVYG